MLRTAQGIVCILIAIIAVCDCAIPFSGRPSHQAQNSPASRSLQGLLGDRTFDVSTCEDLQGIIDENVWVSGHLSLAVYADVANETKTFLSSGNNCSAGDHLSIFQLSSIEPVQQYHSGVFYVSELNTLVISFRGTDDESDWQSNLNTEQADCTLAAPCGKAHAGFHELTMQHAAAVVDSLRHAMDSSSDPSTVRIGITGHSLGGALAQTFAMWLCGHDDALCEAISWVNVFGSPKVCVAGTECSSKYEALLGARTKHFINVCSGDMYDPVPIALRAYDTETAIELPSPGIVPAMEAGNLFCHSMLVYLAALESHSKSLLCNVEQTIPPFSFEHAISPLMESDSVRETPSTSLEDGLCSTKSVPVPNLLKYLSKGG